MTGNGESPSGRTSSEASFDAASAARLVESAQKTMGQALDVRPAAQYLAWGLAWLIGLGTMWLTVVARDPYVGPAGWTTGFLIVLLVAALAVTSVSTARATEGLGGVNAYRGRVFGAAWGVGFAGLWLGIFAVGMHGAPPLTMGLLTGAGSIGLTGLIYLLGSALWVDKLMTCLGGWLVAVAVGGAFAGPVWLLALGAFAGGGGFIVAAALAWRRRGR
ncbi:ABC transporter permease [Spelaeicoccus albus]|uniref:Uncharacterized protein n=1 Tax=Spelaeicoccus albus TaxID=1280376 RepID=A0A7Z0ABJ4_9MICO|nr:ABC transporter permease [Spelaeicoccus albus]NYI67173.1 hypothetical protein [Spelaeicoccus albus]